VIVVDANLLIYSSVAGLPNTPPRTSGSTGNSMSRVLILGVLALLGTKLLRESQARRPPLLLR